MDEKTKSISTKFALFVSQTIAFETGGDKSGAYHNDPRDRGGETKWGISKRAHPGENIKALTFNDALRIYQIQYWNHLYDYISDNRIAFKLFDMGVLSGKWNAVKLLQKAIKKSGLYIRIDGRFGPLTLTACNIVEGTKLYETYIQLYTKRFRRISLWGKNKAFLLGWLRRLNWIWGEDKLKEGGSL